MVPDNTVQVGDKNQHGLKVTPDIPISFHGQDSGSSFTFAKVENINTERSTIKYMFNGSHAVDL